MRACNIADVGPNVCYLLLPLSICPASTDFAMQSSSRRMRIGDLTRVRVGENYEEQTINNKQI